MFRKLFLILFGLMGATQSFRVEAYERPGYGPGQVRLDTNPAQNKKEFEDIQIKDRLGNELKFEGLDFKDEAGATVNMAQYFDGEKPVVLALVYYGCPSLCGLLMNGIVNSLRKIDFQIGKDFQFVLVSINHAETPELANEKKINYLKDYVVEGPKREAVAKGWHFLTGSEQAILSLADQVGFGFKYIESSGEYAHSAGFFILSPQAKISRVLYGVEFEPRDVRLALMEASEGNIGGIVDRLLIYCYRYDASAKGYAIYAMNLVRLGGFFMVLIMAIYLGIFWARQLRRRPGEA